MKIFLKKLKNRLMAFLEMMSTYNTYHCFYPEETIFPMFKISFFNQDETYHNQKL